MEEYTFNLYFEYDNKNNDFLNDILYKWYKLSEKRKDPVCMETADKIISLDFIIKAKSLGKAIDSALKDINKLEFPMELTKIHITK